MELLPRPLTQSLLVLPVDLLPLPHHAGAIFRHRDHPPVRSMIETGAFLLAFHKGDHALQGAVRMEVARLPLLAIARIGFLAKQNTIWRVSACEAFPLIGPVVDLGGQMTLWIIEPPGAVQLEAKPVPFAPQRTILIVGPPIPFRLSIDQMTLTAHLPVRVMEPFVSVLITTLGPNGQADQDRHQDQQAPIPIHLKVIDDIVRAVDRVGIERSGCLRGSDIKSNQHWIDDPPSTILRTRPRRA